MRPRVPTSVVKARTRELTALVDGFTAPSQRLVGTRQLVDVVEVAADGHHLVGHTRNYTQVCVWEEGGMLAGC
jgi:threonylcarbamoyladenosine tRNA methylthiotransferase CDKAL1